MPTDNQTGQTPENNSHPKRPHAVKILRILSSALGFAASAMVGGGGVLLLSPTERTERFGLILASSGFGMGLACMVVAITGIVYSRRRR